MKSCAPSANPHRAARDGAPAVAWPSRHGIAASTGSPADGVPQYIARSATIGCVAWTVMPNAALRRRLSTSAPSASTHTV